MKAQGEPECVKITQRISSAWLVAGQSSLTPPDRPKVPTGRPNTGECYEKAGHKKRLHAAWEKVVWGLRSPTEGNTQASLEAPSGDYGLECPDEVLDKDRRKDQGQDLARGGTQHTFAVAQLMAQMTKYKPMPCMVSHRPALGSRIPKKGRIISARGWGSLGQLHRAMTSDQTPSVIFL